MLRAIALGKRYAGNTVFSGVDLSLAPGEFLAITGESGVGKSTLLNALAGLDRLDEGEVWLNDTCLSRLNEAQGAQLRRRHLGFVFQAFHVLPHLNVRQNVALPLMLLDEDDARRRQERADEALASVGLQGLHDRLPRELSGGQLQRVAVARALIHQPRLILADEPTGNLDPQTAERLMDVLCQRIRQQGAGCIMVTHSPGAAARADRVLELRADGLHAR